MACHPVTVETSPGNSVASRRRTLAHILLIELLSYQFASPVRWVETQDEFFQKPSSIQRYVEIGPAKILATMAEKTAAQQYSPQTASRWSHLQFLSSSDNRKEIFYEYSGNDEPETSNEKVSASMPVPVPENNTGSTSEHTVSPISTSTGIAEPGPAPNATTKNTTTSQASTPSTVVDVVLSVTHIILALTAQKLKRPFDNVSTQKTVRELSGGKSTLQNELIGDLGAELGNLPDGAEDLPLEALGDTLQGSFSGKPGKQMSALISKFISSKMPAGFNQAAIQDHLELYWGISKRHSLVPICFAVTAEPPSRLADTETAKKFFDALISRYASFVGITLLPVGANKDSSAAQSTVMVDSSALDTLKEEQRRYDMKKLKALADHLQFDLFNESKLEELAAFEKEREETLSEWNSEFDEQFLNGIRAIFDARKSRKYDSWWNWIREDLIRWFNDLATGRRTTILTETDDRLLRILSKWEPSCSNMMKYITSKYTYLNDQALLPIAEEICRLGSRAFEKQPMFKYTLPTMGPRTKITATGDIEYTEIVRETGTYSRIVKRGRLTPSAAQIPFVYIRKRKPQQHWEYDQSSTKILLQALDAGCGSGLTYAGKAVLVTGAGPKSIGVEVVQGLLRGGARVVVTTSRPVASTAKMYQEMYRKFGARGSMLTVLPFNQGSKKDCSGLIEHIFSIKSPTGGHLDYIIPFAAIPEVGELDGLDGKSELAHRAMLVNILRLLGYVQREKQQRGINTRPTNFIIPLSPNHGTFGGDGLYSESKLGLETLFNRFHSENWSDYITICGAVIGWTRGTGLMSANNIVAEEIEKHGVMTFSPAEMALNILTLMTPEISEMCEDDPVYADLSGGLQSVVDLKQKVTAVRTMILEESRLRKALRSENLRQHLVLRGSADRIESINSHRRRPRRANLTMAFPNLSHYQDVTAGLKDLTDMVDLTRTVVVVGFSELGPWGSARTRWEMEHMSKLTLEGYVEMAWIMGLVKHCETEINGEPYVGWIDAKTQEPVKDDEFERRYCEHIINHAGLRFIEPEGLGGYDPTKKEFLHEIAAECDLPLFESSKVTADAFKLRHGNKVSIRAIPGSDEYEVHLKRGASIWVPKSVPFDRMVAGQLPSGWNPVRYGIPEDIVQQVDPITLYALCCVCEAFLSAGIEDPYELYKHIHISELANCLGTGAGALLAMRGVYRDRYLDKPVQSDMLQESFLNTTGAWINMLLLSSAGPIRSPVGACATAFESLDTGCEAIQSGKSKVAIVGGCDDFQEEMSYEFAKMKATASSTDELEKGRLPSEMSRPSTSSRNGFVESAGCGVQIIMNAELALEIGLPIYGVIAYTQMAGDKIGRSIPAPGKGILTAVKEAPNAHNSSLLNLDYRRRNLMETAADVQKWHQGRLAQIKNRPGWSEEMVDEVDCIATVKIKQAQQIWGNDIRLQDPSIAPIRASLATWGLTIDDIQVVSMHGTSTKANDTNEADVINRQMTHIGRTQGNPLLAVCQKSLTGHPKGAAGAWQINGCMQMMQTGIVPGNRNADNIDDHLREFNHIVYPMEAIQMTEVKATMSTSFGFGQKGAITIVIAPKYLFSVITEDTFEDYRIRVTKRQRVANTTFIKDIMSNSMFKAKDHLPWEDSDNAMSKVLLNSACRASDVPMNQFAFNEIDKVTTACQRPRMASRQSSRFQKDMMAADETGLLSSTVQNMLESSLPTRTAMTTVGVHVRDITSIDIESDTFILQSFTIRERQFCYNSSNIPASFAGRWTAKEAVFKSMQITPSIPGAAMDEIEILDDFGIPKVELHARAKDIATSQGITSIQVSITYSVSTVTAIALARRT